MHQESDERRSLPHSACLTAIFLAGIALSCRQADSSFQFVDSRGEVFRVTPVTLEKSQYIGELREGMFEGLGLLSRPGTCIYLGRFRDGVIDGRGMMIADYGVTYVGEFHDNGANGLGMAWYKDGRIYMGEFKDGLRHGMGKTIFPDGEVKDGLWEDDRFVKPRGKAVKTGYSVKGVFLKG